MKFRLLIMIISIVFLLTGCAESEASKQQKLVEQAELLNIQAAEHYSDGELKNAIEVYQKSLELTEQPEIRSKVTQIEQEIKAVQTVQNILDELKTAKKALVTAASSADFKAATDQVRLFITDLNQVHLPADTRIKGYRSLLKKELTDLETDCAIFATEIFLGDAGQDGESNVNALTKSIDDILLRSPIPEFYDSLK